MTIHVPGGTPFPPPYDAPPPAEPDPWTSPLWARPDTVGGHWPVETPAVVPPPPPPPRSRRGLVAVIAAVAVAVVAAAVMAGWAFASHGSSNATATPPAAAALPPTHPSAAPSTAPSAVPSPGTSLPGVPAPTQPGSGSQPGTNPNGSGLTPQLQQAAAAVTPGIVDIVTTVGYGSSTGAGTGVVLSSDGLVLTNHHVVAGATSIRVTDVANGRTYPAVVLGYDRQHDIAVLRLTGASGLAVAPLGDSSTVRVGDAVVAVGNAGGVGGTPSAAGGSVTGLDETITVHDPANGTAQRLTGLIKVDAAIRPGDSGGALASADGKVVGIVTAGEAGSSDSDTGAPKAGFAVPINQALAIEQQIVAGHSSATVHIGPTAFLGVQVRTGVSGGATPGALVVGVVPGTAADRAGIVPGDVITGVDGHVVASPDDLTAALGSYRPGDTVTVRWTDPFGTSQSATVRLGTGPVG